MGRGGGASVEDGDLGASTGVTWRLGSVLKSGDSNSEGTPGLLNSGMGLAYPNSRNSEIPAREGDGTLPWVVLISEA